MGAGGANPSPPGRCDGSLDTGGAFPLPVLAADHKPAGKIRASRAAPWRAAVLILVNVLILLHIGLWLLSKKFGWFGGKTTSPIEPSESIEFATDGIVNAGLIFFLIALLSTLVLGRWFCGWGCHLVALQDLCGWMMKKVGVRPKPFRSRLLLWVPLLLALYMFIWPMAYRWVLVPVDGWLGRSLGKEHVLVESIRGAFGFFDVPLPRELPPFEIHWELTRENFWETFPGGAEGLPPARRAVELAMSVPFLLVCSFAAVYFLGAKGFCTYGCPYGGFFAPLDKYSPARIRVTDACEQCGHCTAVCTSNVRVHEEVREYGMVVDPGCMKCTDCVSVCPKDALYFGFGRPAKVKGAPKNAAPKPRYDLSWPEEIGLALVFVGTMAAVRGRYGLIPLLMAVGISLVVTFLVWKAWRMWRDPSVSFHRSRLKYQGALTRSGAAYLACTAVVLLFTGHCAAIGTFESIANRALGRVKLTPQQVFTPTPTPMPEAMRPHAERAERFYRLASRVGDGGLGLATSRDFDRRLAWLAACRGDHATAEAMMRRHMDRFGVSDALVRELAMVIRLQGRDDEARVLLETTVAEDPSSLISLDWLVGWYESDRRFDDARRVLTTAIDAQEDDRAAAQLLRRLAVLEITTGRPSVGIDHLETALDRDDTDPITHLQLAGAFLQRGDTAAAARIVGDALERWPDHPQLQAANAEIQRMPR